MTYRSEPKDLLLQSPKVDLISYWEGVPLDIIHQQIMLFDDPEDIVRFCGDPYIDEKICQDPNGEIWKRLFQRDLSNEIVLDKGQTIKSQYLRDASDKYHKTLGLSLLTFIAKHGYEKLLNKVDLSRYKKSLWLYKEALEQSVIRGNLFIVKYLIENGIYSSNLLNDVFMTAVMENQIPIVEYLLEKGADIHEQEDSALLGEASIENIPMVVFLLEHGANVHAQNEHGLKEALSHSRLELARIFVEYGANVEKVKKYLQKRGDNSSVRDLDKVLQEIQTSNQCEKITKSGQRCCRTTKDNQVHCWQHL